MTREPLFAKGLVDRIVAGASEEVSFFVGEEMTEAAHSVSKGSLLVGGKGRLMSRDVVLMKACRCLVDDLAACKASLGDATTEGLVRVAVVVQVTRKASCAPKL